MKCGSHLQEIIIPEKCLFKHFLHFWVLKQGLNAHECTHDINDHHHMNYVNLDY